MAKQLADSKNGRTPSGTIPRIKGKAPETHGCLPIDGAWLLTPCRAAFHLPTATAVIADLHLGYNEARRLSGEAVPLTGFDELAARLDALLRAHVPRRLVIAGDLVENRGGRAQAERLLRWVAERSVRKTTIVPGNHDRYRWLRRMPMCADKISVGGWHIVHGDGALSQARLVMGHFHPCVRLGRSGSLPCYLLGPRRIILPAFSNDARGANVLGVDTWRTYRCAAIVGREVLDFGDVGDLKRKLARLPKRASV